VPNWEAALAELFGNDMNRRSSQGIFPHHLNLSSLQFLPGQLHPAPTNFPLIAKDGGMLACVETKYIDQGTKEALKIFSHLTAY